MSRKLNAVTLSGLMIGPILGSGILFLPPLAYEKLGEYAMLAWILIMAVGVLFAYVFSRMNAMAPDNRGVSAMIGTMLSRRLGVLAANYVTVALCFGPVAVAITASEIIGAIVPISGGLQIALAGGVLLLCTLIVIADVSFIGKLTLTLSSLTACLLLVGSVAVLVRNPAIALPDTGLDVRRLGSTLLLLFWAIFGWEVLGNYTEDVIDPKNTTMRAMKISLTAIITIYLLTTLAVQQSRAASIAGMLSSVFGAYTDVVFGCIAVGLCICTIVMFCGAVIRQTAARLRAARIPAILQTKKAAAFALLAANLIVLISYGLRWVSFDLIVKSTNVLFIGNAFLGLLCGLKLLKSFSMRLSIGILLLMMLAIFLFLPAYALVIFAAVTVLSLVSVRTPGRR